MDLLSEIATGWKTKFLDPREEQARSLNLRALADARRAREMQMRVAEMKLQQEQQEQAELQQSRQNLAKLPENPTLEQTVGLLGYKHGLPLWKGLQEAREAKGKATKEQLEIANKQALLFANKAEGYLWQEDPKERLRMWETDTPDFLKLQMITEDQAKGPPQLDNAYLESLVATGKGREYLVGLNDKRAKRQEELGAAARAKSKDQIELAGYFAGSVKDRESYDKWRQMLPDEMRPLVPQEYSPENMKVAGNMLLTAQQRAQQLPESAGDWIRIATDPNATREEQARADTALSKFASQSKAGAPQMILSADQKVGNEAQLRGDYRKESANYVVLRDAWGKIQNASKSATGPGDMSLIFAYMKILDPNSTVREGEYATAQNAGSIPERVWAWYNRQLKGEKLDPNVRSQFVHEARQIYTQAEADQAKIRKIYGGIAQRSGLDPENVTVDYSPGIVGRPAQQPSGAARTGQAIPNPIIEVKRGPDGKLR